MNVDLKVTLLEQQNHGRHVHRYAQSYSILLQLKMADFLLSCNACSLVEVYRRSRGSYSRHHEGSSP